MDSRTTVGSRFGITVSFTIYNQIANRYGAPPMSAPMSATDERPLADCVYGEFTQYAKQYATGPVTERHSGSGMDGKSMFSWILFFFFV